MSDIEPKYRLTEPKIRRGVPLLFNPESHTFTLGNNQRISTRTEAKFAGIWQVVSEGSETSDGNDLLLTSRGIIQSPDFRRRLSELSSDRIREITIKVAGVVKKVWAEGSEMEVPDIETGDEEFDSYFFVKLSKNCTFSIDTLGGASLGLIAQESQKLSGNPNWSRDISSPVRSEEHTSELQSQFHLVCPLLLLKK